MKKFLEKLIFSSRWAVYLTNIFLLFALAIYLGLFLKEDFLFLLAAKNYTIDNAMIALLSLIESSLIVNLVVMIVSGSHEIFIGKFNLGNNVEVPRYLQNVDSTILKIKICLSISSITMLQLLKDFFAPQNWELITHRTYLHLVTLLSSLIMAAVWRLTHEKKK